MNKFILFVIAIRVAVDGVFNFKVFDLPISGFISALVIIVFVSTAFRPNSQKTTLIIFIVLALLSSSFYAFITLGAEPVFEAIRFSSILATLHLVLNSNSKFQLPNLLRFLGLIAFANLAFQIFQQTLGQGLFVNSVWRFAGFFAHPNTAALFYAFVLVLVIYQLISGSGSSVSFLVVLLAAGVSGIALTLSVGGIVFAVVAVFALILREVPSRLRLITVGVTFAGLIGTSFVFPTILLRLNSFTLADSYVYGDQTNSLVWRFNQWELYFAEYERNPFFGSGFGGSNSGYLVPNGLLPHNEYLRVLVETGAVGAIFCLILVAVLVRKLLSRSKDLSNWAARCSVPLVVGLSLNSLTENTFLYSVPMLIMAVLLASAFRVRPGQVENF